MNTTRNMSNAKPPVDVEALRGHTPAPWPKPEYDNSDTCAGSWYDCGIGKVWSEKDANLVSYAPELLAEVISRRSRDAAVAELVEAVEESLRTVRPDAGVSVNRLRNALLDLAAPGSLAAACRRGAPE